jgi:N-acetyl-alpha-D-muramate 1-phosphate uridylyltransferase
MTTFTAKPDNITVFILAAGRGERMRPLSDTIPKPLLKVSGKSLLQHHLERLATQGFRKVIINVAHLGQQIIDTVGNGQSFGIDIFYSFEQDGALETLGGLRNALDNIQSEHFLLLNADIWSDCDFRSLLDYRPEIAHLLMTTNPSHHPEGDFILEESGKLSLGVPGDGRTRSTYTGIGIYNKSFIASLNKGYSRLGPLLKEEIKKNGLWGSMHYGQWFDIGTPERLTQVNQLLE